MEKEKKEHDWCGKGEIGFLGRRYLLEELDNEELVAIDMEIKEDKSALQEVRKREDLDNEERIDLMGLISLRKRQINLVIAEFVRRKKKVKPLEDFVMQAVYEICGGEILKEVRERCRELQEKDRIEKSPFSVKHGLLIPPEAYKKDKMCGPAEKPKIKHPTALAAQQHIEDLKSGKHDVRGLNVYGPCPFCGFYHIGHMPEKYLWMKEQEKRAKKVIRESRAKAKARLLSKMNGEIGGESTLTSTLPTSVSTEPTTE